MNAEDRFWAKVDRSGDGCWEWQAARTALGYGVFGVTRTDTRFAHRYAVEVTSGPIPTGKYVMHRCDNPPCVRPSHLQVGTQTDNMHDASIKGRTAQGESHGRRKITAATVLLLRELRAGGATLQSLSDRFGISLASVSLIARGLLWRNVGGPIVEIDPRWRDATDTPQRSRTEQPQTHSGEPFAADSMYVSMYGMAERARFELADAQTSTVFKTELGHRDESPSLSVSSFRTPRLAPNSMYVSMYGWS